jgi:hypothetical protein
MGRPLNNILSASRRTDIPGWYTPWFLDRIQQGFFTVKNPYNMKIRHVDARPEAVHSIVFWSKNFSPFLDLGADRILSKMGYNLYFNFTLNSRAPLLEPNLPELSQRLGQARRLCERFGPDKICWRFDPICFYRVDNQGLENTLTDFTMIADALARMGITRCVTSFYDHYKKVAARIAHLSSQGNPVVSFADPPLKDRQRVIQRMTDHLEQKGITLHLCCESDLFAGFGKETRVKQNACIDGRLLKHLHGGNPDIRQDHGQRAKKGCKCSKSIDIGSYEDHPCFHNCLFCYAATGIDIQIQQGRS